MNIVELESILSEQLKPENFHDYCPNGLQIEGKPELKKIAFAVSSTKKVIEKAIQENCDALFVHHGLFWKDAQPLRGALGKKVSLIIQNKMNLFAYHLPLDAHPLYGNNAGFLIDMGIDNPQPFEDIGFYGILPSSLNIKEYKNKIDTYFSREGIHIIPETIANKKIKNIGIISGAGQSSLKKAALMGCDAFISGESSEQSYSISLENNIVFSVMGHNKTEETGVKKISNFLKENHSLETIFIAENNPF